MEDSTKDMLLAVLMEKEFGVAIQVSGNLNKIYSECVRELSRSILEAIPRAGLRPIPESAKIFIKRASADPIWGHATVGAKVRAEIDTDPKALFCMLVHLVQQADERKERENARADRYLKENGRLWQMIANATSLKELRKKLREEEDKVDYD